MGWFSSASEAVVKIDGGIGRGVRAAKKFYNGSAAGTAKAVARSVASDIKTSGFAAQAALYGGVGGAAGYAYDGRDGAIKGAGLGVLGAAVHRNWKNPTIRAAGRDIRGFAGSKYRSGMASIRNEAANSSAYSVGMNYWGPGVKGPASRWATGVSGPSWGY